MFTFSPWHFRHGGRLRHRFSVSGVSGHDEDVFVFTPSSLGSSTAGTFATTLFFDGSAYGLSSNDIYGIDLR